MQISSHGLSLIMNFEGLRTRAYKPYAHEEYYTIGYGHYGPDVKSTDVITADGAMNLLRSDAVKFSNTLTRHLDTYGLRLNQCQFDALVSFSFNVGVGKLIRSTLWKCLIAGNYEAAANEFLRWNLSGGVISKGLARRREAERKLFLS